MFNNKNKVVPTPPYETNNYVINTKVLSWGEDLGEGFARRVTANECSPLSPSPSPSEREASAFTLAEVLITLVIIGVIAAITVPTLMNKTNNQEYVSKLKKAYSTLSQATNLIIAEEGTPRADKGGWAKDADNVYNLYKKHLNNAKECGVDIGCLNQPDMNFLRGGVNTGWNTIDTFRRLVLTDGVQVMFHGVDEECGSTTEGTEKVCSWLWVDLNGEKKPNTYGRDVFGFLLQEDRLLPRGCDIDACNKTSTGTACACKVLREGAMNY